MKRKQDSKNILNIGIALIGALSMCLLRWVGTGSVLSVVLIVVGMTGFLYGVRHACEKRELIVIACVMALTYAVRFYGYTGREWLDVILGLLIGLIVFALVAVDRLAKKFEDRFWFTLIFPAAYLLFMYFTELVRINMPFRLDIYLVSMPALCQIVSVAGMYSLDFLVAWTSSVIVFAIDQKLTKQNAISAGLYIVTVCAVLIFGLVHINQIDAKWQNPADTVRIACTTGPYYGSLLDDSYKTVTKAETIDSLTEAVDKAAKEGIEILIFAEESYCVLDADEKAWLATACNLAVSNDMNLLLPYEVEDTDDSEAGKSINKLCWITDRGKVVYDYTKQCVIPFIETADYVRGERSIESFDIDAGGSRLRIATAICYDADFDSSMSSLDDVDILFLPVWDWKTIDDEHLAVARLRAIAESTTLVRAAYDGYTAVIDPAGRLKQCERTNEYGYGNLLIVE